MDIDYIIALGPQTFHVTDSLPVALDPYKPVRYVTGVVGPIDAGRPGLLDLDADYTDDAELFD